MVSSIPNSPKWPPFPFLSWPFHGFCMEVTNYLLTGMTLEKKSGSFSNHTAISNMTGQIIATSHDLTPNGGLVREIPLFQGILGWWNISPFGQNMKTHLMLPSMKFRWILRMMKDSPKLEGVKDGWRLDSVFVERSLDKTGWVEKKWMEGWTKMGVPKGFEIPWFLGKFVFSTHPRTVAVRKQDLNKHFIPTAQACPVGCIPFATLHVRRARWSVFSLVVGKLRVGGDDYISTIYPMTDPCHIFKYLHIHTYSPYNFTI